MHTLSNTIMQATSHKSSQNIHLEYVNSFDSRRKILKKVMPKANKRRSINLDQNVYQSKVSTRLTSDHGLS